MDGLGNPLRFVLTAGQVHDSTQARALVEGLTGAYLLADKAYDSNEFRDVIAEHGMVAVIPSNRSRSMAIPYDKHLYKERHLVECFINKIKQFRKATEARHPLRQNRSLLSCPCYVCALP